MFSFRHHLLLVSFLQGRRKILGNPTGFPAALLCLAENLRQYGADGQGCRLGGFLLNDRRTVHPALRMYCVESYMEKGGMSIKNV